MPKAPDKYNEAPADEKPRETPVEFMASLAELLVIVLFLMTFILNGLARLLIVATERGGGRPA